MKKILNIKKIYLFLILVFLPFLAKANLDLSLFAFYKEIFLPQKLDEKMAILVNLDDQVLSKTKIDLGDLRVVEKKDQKEIPFKIFLSETLNLAQKSEILNYSSERENFLPQNTIDGKKETFFQVDCKKNPQFVSFLFNFKKPYFVQKIEILSFDPENTWKRVKIEGSMNEKDWFLIKDWTEIPFSPKREIEFSETFSQYLKLTFWSKGCLKIHEIKIFSFNTPKIIFIGEPSKNYRVYYGNKFANLPKYEIENLWEYKFLMAKLGPQKNNLEAKEDLDGDGIPNIIDNCPLIFNFSQKDRDGDGVGDKCDNCPNIKNPDQKDKNRNKIGDACENFDVFNIDQKNENGKKYTLGKFNFQKNKIQNQNKKRNLHNLKLKENTKQKEFKIFWLTIPFVIVILMLFLSFQLLKRKK